MRGYPHSRLPSLFLFLLTLFSVARAANVTVDDADSAWTYSANADPMLGWGAIFPYHTCGFCLSMPDPTRVNNHTWHDTDRANSATLSFTGIALTVYIICPGPTSQGYIYVTNYSFMLDGVSAGSHNGPGCNTITYNYPIFSKTGLSAGPHTFTISNAPAPVSSMQARSDLLLDYAVYDDGGMQQPSATAPAASRSASAAASSVSSTSQSGALQAQRMGSSALVGILLSVVLALASAVQVLL